MTIFGFRIKLSTIEAVVDSAIRLAISFINQAQRDIDKQQVKLSKAAEAAKGLQQDSDTAKQLLDKLSELR